MVFHVIPWMWGVDGDKTMGISDTLRITEDGCESFFTMDEDIVAKPEAGAAPKTPGDGVHDALPADKPRGNRKQKSASPEVIEADGSAPSPGVKS
jgi:Xaa-Pro dipeptidase